MRRSTRERGPWERVGALVQTATALTTAPALPLFVRKNGRWQDKFDYRTVVEGVPIELDKSDRGVSWINDGDTVTVPGLQAYKANIYGDFR
jgi:hypothetical protein